MNGQLIFGAFLSNILSGFFPLVNAELVVVTAALLVTSDAYVPLLLACVCGRMLAKCCLYGLARWAPQRLPQRARTVIARLEKQWKERRGAGLVVMASAGVGVPPFYLITLAAGAFRLSPGLFAAAGTAGTLARFAVLVWSATRLTH